MDLRMENLTAFVLAGGKSTRMGADKAFLELAGRPLIAHAVALAAAVVPQVRIVGGPEKFAAWGEVVPDVFADRGPLGGIHAGLQASQTDCNLILGVDLPFVETRLLEFLIEQANACDAMVTVPFAAGHFQTLCAVYRKTFLPVGERALFEGRNRVDALFSKVETHVIGEQELAGEGFQPSMFRNLNTQEDWQAARREFEPHQRL